MHAARHGKLVIEPGRNSKHYWREVWRNRELLYFLTWRDILVRYKQTAIGVTWVLLRPALTMAVFIAFRNLAGIEQGAVPEPILVCAAVLPWQFFSSALTESSGSLIANSNLISKVYFPRLLIPWAAVATAFVDFLITLALLGVLMLWYDALPGWHLLALPPFMGVAFALSLGTGLWLAALNVEYRDFRYVVPFIVQLGLFISPVAFTTASVPAHWRPFFVLNPMVGVIDGFQWAIFGSAAFIEVRSVGVAVGVTALLLLFGVRYFRRMERTFADVI
jgi:homopolymeric O-antigen transport system permease protein